MRRLVPVLLAAVLVLPAGCAQSKEEARDAYCKKVKAESESITRKVDEGGAGAALDLLPTLEGLAEESPDDLKDEWQTYLNALRGWRDALDDAGLEPEDVAKGLPKGLSREERQRVLGAISVVQGDDVKAASEGIEQQALDVCGTALL